MPTFVVTSPDGRKFRVTAPEGATQEQVMSLVAQQAGPSDAPQEQAAPKREIPEMDPTSGMNPLQRFLAGSGKAVMDIGRGAGQMLGLVDQATIDEAARMDAPLMRTTAGKIGNIVGNIGATMPAMAIPGANTMVGATLLGGAMGATQPVTNGESRAANTLMGAAGGAAGQGIANAIGRVVRPVRAPDVGDEMKRIIDVAKSNNIPLTAGQITQSRPLQALESTMSTMPFTAGRAEAQRQAQQSAFNRALLGTMGQNGDALTPDVLNAARQRIGGEFSRLSSQNELKATLPFLQRVSSVAADAQAKGTQDVAKIVGSYVDDLTNHISQNGTISGEFYRQIDSKLGRQIRGTTNGDLATALRDLQSVVRQGMDDSISAADQGAWRAARGQYKALKTVGAAVKNDASGEAFPGRLAQSVRRSNENAMLYGTGNTELADLAKVGQLLKDSVPNSGTAERQFWRDFMNGSILTQGAKLAQGAAGFTLGVPLQSMMMSPAGQAYLTQGLLAQTNPLLRTAPYGAALLRGSVPAGLLAADGP